MRMQSVQRNVHPREVSLLYRVVLCMRVMLVPPPALQVINDIMATFVPSPSKRRSLGGPRGPPSRAAHSESNARPRPPPPRPSFTERPQRTAADQRTPVERLSRGSWQSGGEEKKGVEDESHSPFPSSAAPQEAPPAPRNPFEEEPPQPRRAPPPGPPPSHRSPPTGPPPQRSTQEQPQPPSAPRSGFLREEEAASSEQKQLPTPDESDIAGTDTMPSYAAEVESFDSDDSDFQEFERHAARRRMTLLQNQWLGHDTDGATAGSAGTGAASGENSMPALAGVEESPPPRPTPAPLPTHMEEHSSHSDDDHSLSAYHTPMQTGRDDSEEIDVEPDSDDTVDGQRARRPSVLPPSMAPGGGGNPFAPPRSSPGNPFG